MKARSRHEYAIAIVSRFWSYVDRRGPNECWLWTGCRMAPLPCGMQYGYFGAYDEGRTISIRPHRFSYFLANGEIPDDKVVMHTCDVPLCVNPNHLRLGTQRENILDASKKGRIANGSRQGNSKLTEADVGAIRRSERTTAELASLYDTDYTNILRIRRGESWRHVPMPEPVEKGQNHD